jgi:Ran GTPase-activating protein (RanGAP) involved in mRNA processing and transport
MSLDDALAGLTLGGAAAAPAPPSVEVRVDADGIRGLISAQQAATAFAGVMSADASELSAYTLVNLSTKSFAPEAARAAARGLERMGALEVAHMADMISGITEVDALESLRIVSAAIVASGAAAGVLRSIDLSDNALGEKGLRACSTLLSGAAVLEKLYLCNNGLSKEACAALADILLAPLPGAKAPRATTMLTTLNFFNNMSGSGGGVALAPLVRRSPALADFRLASTRCAAEGFVPLCAALRCAESFLLCTVTFYANLAHSLTRSP